MLAKRLTSEHPNFVRLSVDDLRNMFFGPIGTPEGKGVRLQRSCRITRLNTEKRAERGLGFHSAKEQHTENSFSRRKLKESITLVVLMLVEKSELEGRNKKRGMKGVLDAWNKVWENASPSIPVMKFRNNSLR